MNTNSFCTGVCEYDDDKENLERICRGCGRTAEEITEWFYATKERKIEIAKAARQRSKERKKTSGQG